MNDVQLAKGLGWFSLGIGVAELVAPRRLARGLGLPIGAGMVQAFGAREIGAGVAVLGAPSSPGPLWARAGGDVLDLAVLAGAMARGRRPERALVATVAVLGVTVLDVLCATALTRRTTRGTRAAARAHLAPPTPS